MKTHSDLIYDVGLLDGEDTEYYLRRGYRVIAIDANPVMIDAARKRFAAEVRAERLTLLNIGIAEHSGEATFWVCDTAEWSSFDRELAARHNAAHRPLSVKVVPFEEILTEHGVPRYLKIDIEGNDKLCVEALRRVTRPKYISVESECTKDGEVLSDHQATEMLELLSSVGYRRFKLVKQACWLPVRPVGRKHLLNRLVNSAARGRLQGVGLKKIAERFTDSGRISALGFDFQVGSTGPWGNDVPGPWMKFAEAKDAYLLERQAYYASKPVWSFWYDWHATY